MTDTKKPLLSFPTDFTIKVFGNATEEFESQVLLILNKHLTKEAEKVIQSRNSANGKYLALSVTIHADSQEQLDKIYQDLSSSPFVIMAL